jgi:hypothetical protein
VSVEADSPQGRGDSWSIADAHAISAEQLADRLGTDPVGGLTEREARARLERVGSNLIETAGPPSYARIALRQFADPLVALLIGAVVVSLAVGEQVDAIVIAVIVALNGMLGFFQELAAERALGALRETVQQRAVVIGEGRERELAAGDLVPGDLIVLREGERVAADGRIVRAEGLAVEESLLTGESVPADKSARVLPAGASLADRSSMVFAGTAVTRGRALAVVTVTGPRAEIGRVAALAAQAKPPPTPLQRRLGGLTRVMVAAGVLITVGLAGARLAQGTSVQSSFLLGVSVAVAAVPEGLAATVTIALALGARRMAARGAIVRRLAAVETLGSATVIASDKTGTLTENRLRLAAVATAPGHGEDEVLRAAVLASTARLIGADGQPPTVAGDPVEGALLLALHERGGGPAEVLAGLRRVREVPFDPERKRMTLLYRAPEGMCAYMKGAPEVVLERSDATGAERAQLRERALTWAAGGLRRTRDRPGGRADNRVRHDRLRRAARRLQRPLPIASGMARASQPAAARRSRRLDGIGGARGLPAGTARATRHGRARRRRDRGRPRVRACPSVRGRGRQGRPAHVLRNAPRQRCAQPGSAAGCVRACTLPPHRSAGGCDDTMLEEPSSARMCSMLDVINARAGSRSERSSSAIGSEPRLSLAPSSRCAPGPPGSTLRRAGSRLAASSWAGFGELQQTALTRGDLQHLAALACNRAGDAPVAGRDLNGGEEARIAPDRPGALYRQRLRLRELMHVDPDLSATPARCPSGRRVVSAHQQCDRQLLVRAEVAVAIARERDDQRRPAREQSQRLEPGRIHDCLRRACRHEELRRPRVAVPDTNR